MPIFGGKKTPQPIEARRRPMLPTMQEEFLGRLDDGRWSEGARDDGANLMGLIAEKMVIADDPANEVYAIPDMLKRDMELAQRLQSHNPVVYGPALEEWLGTLCAVALSRPGEDTVIRAHYEGLDQRIDDPESPYFLRALAKSLREKQQPVNSFTLFLHRTRDENALAAYVPIAYTYPGMPILLCPVAEISEDLAEGVVPWFRFFRYRDMEIEGTPVRNRGLFQSPLPFLNLPGYQDRVHALRQGLLLLAGAYPLLEKRIQNDVLPHLPAEDGLLGRMQLNGDLLPQLIPEPAEQSADPMRERVESWFTERLCLLDPRRNTRDGRSLAGSFENCWGDHQVRDEAGNIVGEAILPLGERFALYLREAPEQAETLLANLGANLQITRQDHQLDDAGWRSYLVQLRVTENGETRTFQRIYGQEAFLEPDGIDSRYMPVTAVWPKVEDRRGNWQHYYLYYAYDQDYTWPDFALKVFSPDGAWMDPSADRNGARQSTSVQRDFVIPCTRFPRLVGVFVGGEQVGLLLPRPEESVEVQMDQGSRPGEEMHHRGLDGYTRIIGIDYGTSSTIAFYRNENGPDAQTYEFKMNEKMLALPVAGLVDQQLAERLTLDFLNLNPLGTGLYLSLLHRHVSDARNLLPFEMTNIIFAEQINLGADAALKDRISVNLKLSNDATDLVKVQAFLRQIVMMYMWDSYYRRCPAIHWRFSYPRSFSASMIQTFKRNVENLVREASYGARDRVVYASESESIGSFITGDIAAKIMHLGWQAVSAEAGFVCIDIGGGSVDFSLWQKGEGQARSELRAEASFLDFAGNFVLCDTITRRIDPGMLPREAIFKEIIQAQDHHQAFLEMQKILQDLAVPNAPRDKLFHRFNTLWATSINEIAGAIRSQHTELFTDMCRHLRVYLDMIELYLCLLFYFVGCLVRAAEQEGRFQVRPGQRLTLLLTGNGARMLELLPEGQTGQFLDSRLYQTLQFCFDAGANPGRERRQVPQIIPPIEPKREVAFGLTHRDERMFARQVAEVAPKVTESDALASLYALEDQAKEEAEDQPGNLLWVEQDALSAGGKALVGDLFETFWQRLAHIRTIKGSSLGAFTGPLFGVEDAGRLAEDTRGIIQSLSQEANESSNTLAGVYARSARFILRKVR